MKRAVNIDKRLIDPIYQQITASITDAIRDGKLKTGDTLPSIHKLCGDFNLAPGTVIRAYELLREMGLISSKQGKGFFVNSTLVNRKTKIFLLFDRMNAFKEILYDTFRHEFDNDTEIQVFFHHYDPKRFEKLVRENFGKFTHYVLMPHLNANIQRVVKKIPEDALFFIDSLPLNLKTNAGAVFQNFSSDIYTILKAHAAELKNYKGIYLSLSQSDFQFVPKETQRGFVDFCTEHGFNYRIVKEINNTNLLRQNLYIIFDDAELLRTLKLIQARDWKFKHDIGLISFDETPMKELLAGGISVLSTDFELMGKTAANLVKGIEKGQIANPFRLIRRASF